jgi:uncharacterized protein YdeI (YjbR/CyaY-like superfamily)
MKPSDPLYFETPPAFDAWLREHHATSPARWLLLAKKGQVGISHRQALDVALCWGWIDGIVGKWDESHFALRFSPRKLSSNWSAVNIARMAELQALGLVQAPGLAAFEARDRRISEERPADLPSKLRQRFPAPALVFWLAQPPGYRRQVSWWVLSAKQEATRERRLTALIADSLEGRRAKVAGSG